MRRTSVTLATACALLAAVPSPAAAETPDGAIAWGGTALELSMAGVFYLNFGTDLVPNHGPGMIVNFTPIVIAPAIGWAQRNADPTPALVVHGAAWYGLDAFLIGTLIDGRADRDRMRIGTTALALGAVGTVAGGLVAAREVDRGDETSAFMAAAPLGFAAGGLVLGGLYVLIGGIDGDKAPSQFATGAAAGLALGLAASTVYCVTHEPGDAGSGAAQAASKLSPRVEPGPQRVMFSVGGSF